MSKRLIALVLAVTAAVQLAGCAQWYYAAVSPLPAGQTEVTVPVKSGHSWLLAPVEINGQDAGWFVVDTGANTNVVDTGVADRLKLPTAWRIPPKSPKAADGKMREVRSLSVGVVTFGSHDVATMDMVSAGFASPNEVGGILGAPVLKELPFTLDYRKCLITFHDREQFRAPAGAASFPLDSREGLPYVKCRVNDSQEGWILLDSGAADAVVLNHAYWRKYPELNPGTLEISLGGSTADGTKKGLQDKLATMEILGHRFQNVPAALAVESKDDLIGGECIGLVGGGLLVNFRLTFDYKAKKVWAEWNPEESVSELVARGADLDAKDYFGWTRLDLAITNSQTERVKELLAAGAGKRIREGGEKGVLGVPLFQDDPEIAKALIEAGAETSSKIGNDLTYLMIAAARGHGEVVRMLIARGADVNAADKKGQTALGFAAAKGDLGTVRALIVAGADVNAGDQAGGNPLTAAAFAAHAHVVRALLDSGANVNAAMKDGNTALMSAAAAGHIEVVEMLLDAGADVNARDDKARTALDHAKKGKHSEVVRLLRGHKGN